jgi:hypothetical protein
VRLPASLTTLGRLASSTTYLWLTLWWQCGSVVGIVVDALVSCAATCLSSRRSHPLDRGVIVRWGQGEGPAP